MSVFEVLSKINVNEHTEKKNGLTYLSWAWAWGIAKRNFPEAYYTIYENSEGWNYFTDGKTAWVKTGVTIEGQEHIEYLPVMDFKNQSVPVNNITSVQVNKTIQRSLTKALARHGLGLYIYAGEDLPNAEQDEKEFAIAEEAADEKKREAIRAEKIGETRAVSLFGLLEKHNVDIPLVLDAYGAAELKDLTEEAHADIVKNIDILSVATICKKNDIDMRWMELKPAQAKKILADVPAFLEKAKEHAK